jgi:hypothetical protein
MGIPEYEKQAIHTTHNAQLTEIHGATFPINTTTHNHDNNSRYCVELSI